MTAVPGKDGATRPEEPTEATCWPALAGLWLRTDQTTLPQGPREAAGSLETEAESRAVEPILTEEAPEAETESILAITRTSLLPDLGWFVSSP